MGLPVSGARFVVGRLPGPGEVVALTGEDAAHARARRLAEGDAVVLVDGSGDEAACRVEHASRGAVRVRVEAVAAGPRDPLPAIRLYVAALRAERLAWIAEKATELGAAAVTLVVSERTQALRAGAAVLPRLARVVAEAAKQSERSRWPAVAGPVEFAAALAAESARHRLLLDPRGEPFPAALPAGEVALLVGPEGGWSDAEHAAALAAGWLAISLAAGKLRAETAAVSGLTLARAALARGSH
jgi:16S rRNA (uracil1498-N3)-methyltransferase